MVSPPLLLLFLLLLAFVPGGVPDLAADAAALLAFRSAVGRSAFEWNATASPCLWHGVSCSNGRVSALRLPGAGLIGEIPAGTVGNLTELRSLSLRLNALSGSLPPDFDALKNLRGLFLHGNRLSGQLPASLFSLAALARLDLAANNFSGGISPGFNNLTRLRVLLLENNHFSGEIPDINLRLLQFNVSYNNLSGSVPRGLSLIPATAFLGMPLCGSPLQPCANVTPPSPSPSLSPSSSPSPSSTSAPLAPKLKKSSKLSGGAIAGIAVGSAIGLMCIIALVIYCSKRGGRMQGTSAEETASKPAAEATEKRLVFLEGSSGFELEDLLKASAEVLGKGAYATAYKAMMEGGQTVAVKRVRDVNLEEREFRARIQAIGSINHRNVVKLMAYYFSKDEKLLVYEYLPGGSLSAHLHGNRGSGLNPLDWKKRCGIALAAARGVEFIHSTSSTASHGNIKSSNILLHKEHVACVADYGLPLLVSRNTMNHTAGYRAPEVTDARKVSQMADVYSFGVLLLELLTGKAPAQTAQNAGGIDLPRWVLSIAREEWKAEVFDFELLGNQNAEEYMVQLLQLALECVAQYPPHRPTMSEVAAQIEKIYGLSFELHGGQDDQLSQVHRIDDTEYVDESWPSFN